MKADFLVCSRTAPKVPTTTIANAAGCTSEAELAAVEVWPTRMPASASNSPS
jgi:hypothetical protein